MGTITSRKIKSIAFNLKSERDLFEFAEGRVNFSDWVKEKMRDEIYGVRIKLEKPRHTTQCSHIDEKVETKTFEIQDDMLM